MLARDVAATKSAASCEADHEIVRLGVHARIIVVVLIVVGEALHAIPVLYVSVLVVLVDGVAEPSSPVLIVENRMVVQLQSE